ncbi:hypothetical protein HNO88_001839 [Novosphingobium chloroacetimidivorans]|uniref:Uncharacterized protein n=1 Tax=Novosphingobium chloroacetimidivorans TaxID=1428314 RepID=A0A7W7NVP7_9SPHN|nr:hypothetical protein [Novosphingobium chloroacetimidivorans]
MPTPGSRMTAARKLMHWLSWARSNRLVNSIVIVGACAVYLALLGPEPRSFTQVHEVAARSKTTRLEGVLDFADIRHRYLRLRTCRSSIRVQCDSFKRSIGCYPHGEQLPTKVSVEIFRFEGRNILMSVRDINGTIILNRATQLRRLKGNAMAVAKLNVTHYVWTGLIMGMVFALLRDFYLRRQQRSSERKATEL